ncbi:MAG: LysM domain-containing protein [Verrucomicrobiota bacterium]|jgi:LysM repeat protein
MQRHILLFLSLGVNLAFVAAWLLFARHPAPAQTAAGPLDWTGSAKTNVLVRRQYFSWSQVESADYPTYIANLRAIGCPEQTIRDIIIADVNALYARKLATDVVTPEQQWWRSDPNPTLVRAAAERTRLIDAERRALLTRLLGPSWESGDLASLQRPSRPPVTLDGPVLGVLPAETKQAVQDISVRAQERLQAYLQAQSLAGKPPDPAELAKLRQQTRDELARTLSPQQLEEYLLRYSQDASRLRGQLGQLKYFDASPDEFRSIFRATDSIDQQLQLLGSGNDSNTVAQRNALQQQRDNAIKLALGPDRYAEFTLLQDPAYRDAFAAAQQAGDPDAVQALYQINLAMAQQQAAIRANTNLPPEQMAVQLKQAELDQAKANAQALGQDGSEDQSPASANSQAPSPPVRTHPYVLGAGQTAATVATTYGVSLDAIQAANPGIDIRNLKPGDAIRVPDSLPAR